MRTRFSISTRKIMLAWAILFSLAMVTCEDVLAAVRDVSARREDAFAAIAA